MALNSEPRYHFDGIPGQTIYASTTQVNVIAPAGIAGRTLVQVRVDTDGIGSDSFTSTVRDAMPGIFTLNGSGAGPGAIVNQDGTINSAGNPAAPGTIVSVYGTGQGMLNSASVRILGTPCEILFAGQTAPGLYQVNVRVPENAFATDRAPVELTVGDFPAQSGVTMAIR